MQGMQALGKAMELQQKTWVLLCGENEFLKRSIYEKLIAGLQMPELNLTVFDGDVDATTLQEAVGTLPFLDERRVIVVRDTAVLSAQSGAEQSKAWAALRIPDCNRVIVWTSGKADKRKALYKQIAERGAVVDCDMASEAEMMQYIEAAAKRSNLLISRAAARRLNEKLGGDFGGVHNEMQKLASICRGEITEKDIDRYVIDSMQFSVFRLHELMIAGQREAANRLLTRIFAEDSNQMGLITLLSNNFRQMLIARACRDARYDERRTIEQVMTHAGVADFVARKAVAYCKSFSAPQLRRGIKKFAQMDFDAKQGVIVLQQDLFPLLVDIYAGKV